MNHYLRRRRLGRLAAELGLSQSELGRLPAELVEELIVVSDEFSDAGQSHH